jgi:hypothetical protein
MAGEAVFRFREQMRAARDFVEFLHSIVSRLTGGT